MRISEKIEILNDLYIQGHIDKEDYITMRRKVEPATIKLHGIIREMREAEEIEPEPVEPETAEERFVRQILLAYGK